MTYRKSCGPWGYHLEALRQVVPPRVINPNLNPNLNPNPHPITLSRKRNGWRCSTGEAQHADLWNKILPLVDAFGPNLQVLHVPSHCSIPGNEKADRLADQGLRNSPHLASPPKARRFALVDIEIDSDES